MANEIEINNGWENIPAGCVQQEVYSVKYDPTTYPHAGYLYFWPSVKYIDNQNSVQMTVFANVHYLYDTNWYTYEGNGFTVLAGYRYKYGDGDWETEGASSSEWFHSPNTLHSYFATNGITLSSGTYGAKTEDQSTSGWTVTLNKQANAPLKVEWIVYCYGDGFPDKDDTAGTNGMAAFFMSSAGKKLSIDTSTNPLSYDFGLSKQAPSVPKITATYPTTEKPRELTVNWTYGEITTNPDNTPTMCQLWRKNSKSGDNWTVADGAIPLETYTLGTDHSTWPKTYTHYLLDQNEKYKYMVRVWNEAGTTDSDPTSEWIYSQPAAPVLKNAYSRGGTVFYEVDTDNILYQPVTTDISWRLNDSDEWKIGDVQKTTASDNVYIKILSKIQQDGGNKLFSDYNNDNGYLVPNIITPWINIDFSYIIDDEVSDENTTM